MIFCEEHKEWGHIHGCPICESQEPLMQAAEDGGEEWRELKAKITELEKERDGLLKAIEMKNQIRDADMTATNELAKERDELKAMVKTLSATLKSNAEAFVKMSTERDASKTKLTEIKQWCKEHVAGEKIGGFECYESRDILNRFFKGA